MNDRYTTFVGGLALVVVLGLSIGHCLGCVSPERTASNTVAAVSNATMPVLVAGWTQEALACVAVSTTRAASDACVADVDKRWVPVWLDYAALKAAHDLFRKALESGAAPRLSDLKDPYCKLRSAARAVYALADWPLGACP